MNDPDKCRHVRMVKAGKHVSKGRIRQLFLCKDCGKTILGNDINEPRK